MSINVARYQRLLQALDANELELFVQDWITQKVSTYHECENFTGNGDKGRDVVGFLSKKRHEGKWHNYQCKQYRKTITIGVAILEIGKILYYSSCGEFTVPEKYFFIAPKGVNRSLEKLISNPNMFKQYLIDHWEEYCGKKIIRNQTLPLDERLLKTINSFDFSSIKAINSNHLLNDPDISCVLYKWFNHDPGEAPKGEVPLKVKSHELEYVKQLIQAYSEQIGHKLSTYKEIEQFKDHHNNFKLHRIRFYDADAFNRYYRDNTDVKTVEQIKDDIYFGVIESCNRPYKDILTRIQTVLSQVTCIQVSGNLSKYTNNSVRQGLCHHLVNEGKMKWIL